MIREPRGRFAVVEESVLHDRMVNRRFGSLVVISVAGRGRQGWRYRCACDCGGTTVATGKHLGEGGTMSCGCRKRRSHMLGRAKWQAMVSVGDVFGRLTVMELVERPAGKTTCRYYRCRCSCGAATVVRSALLTNGQTKSCGCLRKMRHLWIKREAA